MIGDARFAEYGASRVWLALRVCSSRQGKGMRYGYGDAEGYGNALPEVHGAR